MADDGIILGIDLGTTFSAMAYVDRHGKPCILPNAEGHPTTPSVIHFYGPDACVVGDEAVKMAVIDSPNVVRFIKRMMGEPDYALEYYDRTYSPQELSALILRKLKEDAEEALGIEITDAVITVPAYFNSAQRGATTEAGTLAGLNVLSILNEPTAAAIAYGVERVGGDRNLLVFDLGGGTFDVTVMEIRGTQLRTIATNGNAELGGKDWDDRILNHVAEQFVQRFAADPRDDLQAYQELYERCLAAKIALSTKPRAAVPVNFAGQRLVVNLTREEFEALSRDLVDQCADTTELVLDEAQMDWEDIDDVLLAGGSTRMPMIQAMLRERFGRPPVAGVNPDECVALGASLAAVFRHRPKHAAIEAWRKTAAPPPAPPPRAPVPVEPAAPSRGASIALAESGKASAFAAVPLADTPVADTPVAAPPVGDTPVAAAPRPPVTAPPPIGGPAIGLPASPAPPAVTSAASSVPAAAPPPTVGALPDVAFTDVASHPLGIVVLDRQLKERVVPLIPAYTALPCEKRGRFAYAYDGMTAVRVEVTEGNGGSREEVVVIGEVILDDLPPRPRGTPIEVVYRYNINQILEIDVTDVETHTTRRAVIHLRGALGATDLEAARQRIAAATVR